MSWITPHSFLSLNWDEWASIIAILGAVVMILRWTLRKANDDIFGPIRQQISNVNKNLEEYNKRQEKAEERLEAGDKKFIHHDEQLRNHERRITHLEDKYENH